MPKESGKELSEASGRQEKNSVYDFLYHDSARIASFLSQFEPEGYLQSSTKSESVSDISDSKNTMSASGGIPLAATGSASSERNKRISTDESLSRTYDPLWQNSLALLDYLQERDLLFRDVYDTRIGRFVLVTGHLLVFDMGIIKSVITTKSLKNFVSKQFSVLVKKPQGQGSPNLSEIIMEFMNVLPYGVQMRLIGDGFQVFSSLRPEGLSLSTDDLLLKHGPRVAGEWSMLGILDALPDTEESDDFSYLEGTFKAIAELGPAIRPFIGRPKDAFGMTPLLIFREVNGS